MRVIRRLPVRLLVGVVCAAVVGMLPATAMADESIQIGSARLDAKGVVVNVTVTFTCTAGDTINAPFDMSVYVQQAISKTQQATGNGNLSSSITCTGGPQSTVLQVLANASGPPFKVGVAAANASIQDCTLGFPCATATTGLLTVRLTH